MPKATVQERAESCKYLRETLGLKEGSTVYSLVTHVAPSGMSRRIRLFVVKDGDLFNITWHASRVSGLSLNDDGLLVRGCGMDMCWNTVHNLSHDLFQHSGWLVNRQI